MNATPRLVGLLALTAMVPTVAFLVLKSEWIVVVALVNVLLITGSLAVAMSPIGEHADANGV
jgi:hypothetical protein